MKNRLLLAILFLLSMSVSAQSTLKFDEALAYTLQHNYAIQMAKIDENKAENNSAKGNHGYLPTVKGGAAYDWTYYQGKNELITGDISYDPNNSFVYNANLTLNYTLFDGMARQYRYLQAIENLELSELQLSQLIETTTLELNGTFNEIARLQGDVSLLTNTVHISQERLERTKIGLEYGQNTELDVLNAVVDLNTDSINLVNTSQQLTNLKLELNYVMGQEIEKAVEVDENINFKQDITREEVLESAEQNNLQLIAMNHNIKLSEYSLGLSKASWMPALNANAGFLYRGSDDPNGAFVKGSYSFGPKAGMSLSWNIYDKRNSISLQNAKLDIENREIEKYSLVQNIRSQALAAYGNYLNALFVYSSQQENVLTAKQNFRRSEETFKLGQISTIEFRQAQLNLLNAEQNLNKSKYDAKNAEMQLLALMGKLVKN